MPRNRERRRIYLREWRKHRNLTQEQLAARLNVDRTIVSKLETGKLDYNQAFLEEAAVALGCDPVDIIVRDPSQPSALWTIWDSIPEADRPRALAILEALKSPTKKAG